MKVARIVLPAMVLALACASPAWAQEGTKGRALLQMIDAIYGDFSKCTEVPSAAVSKESERKFLVPLSSVMKRSYESDRGKIVDQFSKEPAQKMMVQTAFVIAYWVLNLLISIALSSIFLWLGANIAGEKVGTFRTALVCSSFDRVIIYALAIGLAFGLGVLLNGKEPQGSIWNIGMPIMLVGAFFLISTAIVKIVYKIKWGKAFLIQLCTRVAVFLVTVFILGFASAVSLAASG